ncbi:(2E,6E)-farnesyl diphosphate synthase [hydrothermal vent metagenome]|uniref:(2E,6E)-farnesyl diphosphate synthase n=1 Tax=hydrothermal vent metagenome TaxID=652676 RepID=A0A3B0R8R6_9ZZZZ
MQLELTFAERLEAVGDQVTLALDTLIPRAVGPESDLYSAMRYAALGGGKRLRPLFVLECGGLFDLPVKSLLRVATAVECIHTYSLIHDDLPCMDDDDLRRGRPTVHKAYSESMAVLAGDALQTLAFEILADEETSAQPRIRVELIASLAKAAGGQGMVGGQAMDMAAATSSTKMQMPLIARMQRMKTGALIQFAVEASAIMSGASAQAHHALSRFANDLGLAFQITDDLLDVEGDVKKTGKAVGKDAAQGKASFVEGLGVKDARARSKMLADQAKAHLDIFGDSATILRQSVDFVINRSG